MRLVFHAPSRLGAAGKTGPSPFTLTSPHAILNLEVLNPTPYVWLHINNNFLNLVNMKNNFQRSEFIGVAVPKMGLQFH